MSERIAAGEILTGTVTGERIDTDALPNSNERDRSRKKGVRQSNELASPPPSLADLPNRPAHPSNRLVAQLNASWRVIDDPLQWILQRRKGNPRARRTPAGETAPSAEREDALLRCVREYCGLPEVGTRDALKLSRWMERLCSKYGAARMAHRPEGSGQTYGSFLGDDRAPNFVEMPQ